MIDVGITWALFNRRKPNRTEILIFFFRFQVRFLILRTSVFGYIVGFESPETE